MSCVSFAPSIGVWVFGEKARGLWKVDILCDLLSCRVQDDDEEGMSDQVMVGQAAPGTLASGNGNDNTDSQVVLGVAIVHVDAVLL